MSQKQRGWQAWRRKQITPELVDELAGHFGSGATVKIAAGLIGVPPGVLRYWLREGERQVTSAYENDDDRLEPEGQLYVECARTTAEYLRGRVADVTQAESEWRAASWLLERRDDDFNPARKVEVSGPEGGPLQVEGQVAVGWADLLALAQAHGQGHLLGLPTGGADNALPAAPAVLPDPAEPESAADDPARVPGP